MAKRDWTEIDAQIRELYPSQGADIAPKIGLSRSALYIRASKIGVRCVKKQAASDHQKAVARSMMLGKTKSQETRRKLSEALSGRKHSPDRLMAIAEGLRNSRKASRGMTRPERKIDEIQKFMFGPYTIYEFTGDRRHWIRMPDGRMRNPDFTSNELKKVVEVFGRYWHRDDDPDQIIASYRDVGWDCLVLWEDEIHIARDAIYEFTFPYEFQHEIDSVPWDEMML